MKISPICAFAPSVYCNQNRKCNNTTTSPLMKDVCTFKGIQCSDASGKLNWFDRAKDINEEDICALIDKIEQKGMKPDYLINVQGKTVSRIYEIGGYRVEKADNPEQFDTQYKALKKLPEDMTNTEKFCAKVSRDNNYYLVTKISKASKMLTRDIFSNMRYFENYMTTMDFRSFMHTLSELDKAGVYHNDLNADNITLTKEGPAVQGYFNAQTFGPNDRVWNCPSFMYPSNLADYEAKVMMDTIDCLMAVGAFSSNMVPEGFYIDDDMILEEMTINGGFPDAGEYLLKYLQEKSSYHMRRAAIISENADFSNKDNRDALRYEQLEAKFLKDYAPKVADYELDKIRIQNHNFKGYLKQGGSSALSIPKSMVDRAKGIITAFELIEKVEQDKTKGDSDYAEYLDYQKKFAEFWLNNTINWAIEYLECGNNLNPDIKGKDAKSAEELKQCYSKIHGLMYASLKEAKEALTGGDRQKAKAAVQNVQNVAEKEIEFTKASDRKLKYEKSAKGSANGPEEPPAKLEGDSNETA